MPRYIIKLTDQDESWYLEWSTIVDAPITYGLSLNEFKDWYLEEYGRKGYEELADRLKRVEKTGTSCLISNLEDVLSCNRAGPKETELTKEQLIDKYCRRKK
jgi:hypothetical protein